MCKISFNAAIQFSDRYNKIIYKGSLKKVFSPTWMKTELFYICILSTGRWNPEEEKNLQEVYLPRCWPGPAIGHAHVSFSCNYFADLKLPFLKRRSDMSSSSQYFVDLKLSYLERYANVT